MKRHIKQTKKEFYIVISEQFRTLAMLLSVSGLSIVSAFPRNLTIGTPVLRALRMTILFGEQTSDQVHLTWSVVVFLHCNYDAVAMCTDVVSANADPLPFPARRGTAIALSARHFACLNAPLRKEGVPLSVLFEKQIDSNPAWLAHNAAIERVAYL